MFFGQILSVTNIALLSLAEYKGAFSLTKFWSDDYD